MIAVSDLTSYRLLSAVKQPRADPDASSEQWTDRGVKAIPTNSLYLLVMGTNGFLGAL